MPRKFDYKTVEVIRNAESMEAALTSAVGEGYRLFDLLERRDGGVLFIFERERIKESKHFYDPAGE